MRIRIGWPGNEGGEQGWRVAAAPVELRVVIDDVPDAAVVVLAVSPVGTTKVVDGVPRTFEVSIAKGDMPFYRPTRIRVVATREATSDTKEQSVILVPPTAQRLAAWTALLTLASIATIAWIVVKLPSSDVGPGLKLLLATGAGTAVTTNFLSLRSPRALPWFGWFHDLRIAGCALTVAIVCVQVLPRRLLLGIRNETTASISLSQSMGSDITLPNADEVFVFSGTAHADAWVRQAYDRLEDKDRYCMSQDEKTEDGKARDKKATATLQHRCDAPASDPLVAFLGIPEYAIRCDEPNWKPGEDVGVHPERSTIKRTRDCKLDPKASPPDLELQKMTRHLAVPDAASALEAVVTLAPFTENDLAGDKLPEPWPFLDKRARLRLAKAGRSATVTAIARGTETASDGPFRIASVEARLNVGPLDSNTGWALLPWARGVDWFSLEVDTAGKEHRLGTVECRPPTSSGEGSTSSTQFVLWPVAFTRTRLASLSIVEESTVVSRWLAESDGLAWMCLADQKRAELSAEINLSAGWQPNSEWALEFPSDALPRTFSIYLEDRVLVGTLRCEPSKVDDKESRKGGAVMMVGPVMLGAPASGKSVTVGVSSSSVVSRWQAGNEVGAQNPWVCRKKGATQTIPVQFDSEHRGGDFYPSTGTLRPSSGRECFVYNSQPAVEVKDPAERARLGCGLPADDWREGSGASVPAGCNPAALKVCPRVVPAL